jgi:hypothetical protein
MSGMVLHPGHEELHGVTVFVEGTTGMAWVGRYHEKNERGVLLLDVSRHDPASATLPRAAWLERLRKYGITVDAKHVVVPFAEVGSITRLSEVGQK